LGEAERILEEEGSEALTDQIVDGNLIPQDDKSLSNEETESKNGESYVVIMGTFSGDVPQELANLFIENKKWGIRKIQGPGNGAIYLSEEISSLKDARELLNECKRLGVRSASIGTMKNGQITSVQIE
jgi:hypothetical protein